MSQYPAFGEKKLIGENVYFKHNCSGILRFVGKLHFDEEMYCGIELDEPIGKNDGTVKGVRYFTCKPKFGLFVPANEVSLACYKDVGIDMNIYDFITQDIMQPTDRVLDQNASFKIKFPVIDDENLDLISSDLSCFEKIGDINKCKNHSLEQNQSPLCSSFDQGTEKVESFEESEDSLGIIPHLINLSSDDACSMNLNKNSDENLEKCDILYQLNELALSPVEFVPNIIFSKSEENSDAPKYASTPKHEMNSSYVIEEYTKEKNYITAENQDFDILNNEICSENIQNDSIHSECSSKIIDEQEKEYIFSEDRNALNKTLDILKPANSNIAVAELNRLDNTENIPMNVLNKTISYPTADGKNIIEENVDKCLNTTYKIIEESSETNDGIEENQLLSKTYLSLSADKSLNAYKAKSSRNLSFPRITDSSIPLNVKSKPLKLSKLRKSHSGIPVKVESKLSASVSSRISTKSVQSAPSPPEGLLKVFNIHTDSCTLRWNPCRDIGSMPVKHYVIEIQDGKARGGWIEVAKTKDTIFKYENLIPKKEYKFRIKAVNDIGSSKPLISSKAIFAKDPYGKTSLIPKRTFQKKST